MTGPKRTTLLHELVESRSSSIDSLTFDQYLELFSFNNTAYPFMPSQTLATQSMEIGGDFLGLIEGAYKTNGVVFACMLVRQLLFSEARFQFRQVRGGRPGDLFGTNDLAPLEHPGPGKTTGDMLVRAIQDADLAGNWYGIQHEGGIQRLRPDWVTIVSGKRDETPREELLSGDLTNAFEDVELLGYIYTPGGPASGAAPRTLTPDQVAHFAPIPDPAAKFRGMSWLQPVIREIIGDAAAAQHKVKFFENGATPNLIVSLDPAIDQQTFRKWIEAFNEDNAGLLNAYKTMYLGGGANAQVVGANLRQIDFATTQGHGETRIAAAAGVPPVIVGLSEGLAAATYSNYSQAIRRFADGTMRPLWRNMAGSLANIIPVPAGAELWYDDRDIPFLADDRSDAAKVQQLEASSIQTLVQAGYDPQSVIDAINSTDWSRLQHSGLVSVQMQPIDGSQNGGSADPALLPSGSNGGTADG